MTKVYKLMGESPDISEEPHVYETYVLALDALKDWEDFLGMTAEQAVECDEVRIEEWDLNG